MDDDTHDEPVDIMREAVLLEIPAAPQLGFEGPTAILFGAGIVLLLLTGLFQSIILTADSPDEAFVDTTIWFGWVASSVFSIALIAAGYLGKGVRTGVRVALLLVGSYLFIQTVNGAGSALTSLAGLFAGFP